MVKKLVFRKLNEKNDKNAEKREKKDKQTEMKAKLILYKVNGRRSGSNWNKNIPIWTISHEFERKTLKSRGGI